MVYSPTMMFPFRGSVFWIPIRVKDYEVNLKTGAIYLRIVFKKMSALLCLREWVWSNVVLCIG